MGKKAHQWRAWEAWHKRVRNGVIFVYTVKSAKKKIRLVVTVDKLSKKKLLISGLQFR